MSTEESREERKFSIVIFDLDGTLIDAYPAIIRSFNFTMKRLGVPVQDELTIRRAVGWGLVMLLEPFVDEALLDQAVSMYKEHHARALKKKTRLFPGARRLLRLLKNRGYKLAVASNRPTRFSLLLMRHLKIEKYFDYVLCADKVTKPKPHPDILLLILRKFGLKPEDAVYVGDMAIDIQAGKKAKIKTVVVPTGSSTHKELLRLKPYKVVANLSQFSRMIKEGQF